MEKLWLKTNMTQRLVKLLPYFSQYQRPLHTICNLDSPSLHLDTSKQLLKHAAVRSCEQRTKPFVHKSSSHEATYSMSGSSISDEKKICSYVRLIQSVTISSCLKQSGSLLSSKGWNSCKMPINFCVGTSVFNIRSVSGGLSLRNLCTEATNSLNGKLENLDSADLNSSEDIAMVAKYVMIELSKKDKMILSMPEQKIKSIIKTLLDYNLSAEMVQDLLAQNPGLLKGGKLQQCLSLLAGFGFSFTDLFKVLKDGQSLAKLKPNQIEDVFDALRKAGMKEGTVKELITEEPNVLSLVEKDIQSRISQLKAYFKTEDVIRVIAKTPVVLVCDFDEIVQKFNYAHHEMGASQRQIMYTYLFAYPLHHVKCRHEFLLRTGLFGTEKASRGSNPRLQDVIDTSDTDFVKQFGGMHVDEYLTFCKMMLKNNQHEED